ncbi:MAG: MmcQ/YjbR family DNA-binding protein [Deltaproteobacteria bacterium]|nr:MmcQ/YjbR family DNA-binding protein [Myxococcales bacterium]MDP3218707.1 MmcQ/YjbR family DNA-binding protein [Deltaproteobacteria bacterium]
MADQSDTTEALLTRVRAICHDFAGTEEKLSHGAPWFHVRGKGMLTFANDHHGDGRVAVWCWSTPDEQRRLVRMDPDVYFVPPYVGVKGWVGVRLERPTTDFEALAALVEEAWRAVAPKRLASAAPVAPPPPVYPTTDPEVVREARARLAEVCATLPGSVVEVATSQTTWRVGKRPFAYLLDNQHRDGIVSVCFRVAPDEAAALVQRAPRRYYRPPYIGARGWVAMHVDGARVPWTTLARRVVASYRSVAPASR